MIKLYSRNNCGLVPVCAQITGYPLVQVCPGKSVVRSTDRPAMTIAVDMGRKATKQTKQNQETRDASKLCHGLC